MIFYVLTRVVCDKGQVTLTLSPADSQEGQKAERLILTEKAYQKLGALAKGTILSEESAELLRSAHRRYEAVRRALSILAAADNSAAMLYRKLRLRSIAREDAAFAVAYVQKKGLIREREQLYRQIAKLANEKLYGPARILAALCEKGYRAADIRACIDGLVAQGELDFNEIRRTLYEKKKPQDEAERQKLAFKHGFDRTDFD